MHDYSDYASAPDENILKRLSDAAGVLQDLAAEVAEREKELAASRAAFIRFQDEVIPDLMEQANMADFTTASGVKVSIKEKVRCTIPADAVEETVEYLDSIGAENLVKRQFTIEFNKDEEGWARKFEGDLKKRKKPLHCKRKRTVHPQTLSKWAREMIEAGENVDWSRFHLFRQRQAKIEKVNG